MCGHRGFVIPAIVVRVTAAESPSSFFLSFSLAAGRNRVTFHIPRSIDQCAITDHRHQQEKTFVLLQESLTPELPPAQLPSRRPRQLAHELDPAADLLVVRHLKQKVNTFGR